MMEVVRVANEMEDGKSHQRGPRCVEALIARFREMLLVNKLHGTHDMVVLGRGRRQAVPSRRTAAASIVIGGPGLAAV